MVEDECPGETHARRRNGDGRRPPARIIIGVSSDRAQAAEVERVLAQLLHIRWHWWIVCLVSDALLRICWESQSN